MINIYSCYRSGGIHGNGLEPIRSGGNVAYVRPGDELAITIRLLLLVIAAIDDNWQLCAQNKDLLSFSYRLARSDVAALPQFNGP